MTSVIQVRRRVNGATGSPAAAGMKEGELAINFPGAAGGTAKPEVYAFDGTAWRRTNPDATISTQSVTFPAAANIGAAFTAWAATPTNVINGNVVVATFGTPPQAYVLTNPAAPGVATSWTSLGGAVSFATLAELLAGTDTAKALNSAVMRSMFVTAPNATPANDQNKAPLLDATGKIPTGFLPVGGLNFSGSLDPTAVAYAAPTPAPTNGQFYTVSKAGAVSAAWKPQFANAGLTTVAVGDFMVWDAAASKFHHIANAIDMSAYLALAGGTMASTGNITFATPALAGLVTRINGGDPAKSAIDGFTIDMGTF